MTPPLEHLDGSGSSSPGPPADLAATAVSIACPGCRRLVPVGTPCRSCGRTATPDGVNRDLTVVLDPAPDATLVMEPVPPAAASSPMATAPPAPVPSVAAAPPAPVRPVAAPFPMAAAPPAPVPPVPGQSRPRRRPAGAVLGGAAALVLVAAAAVAGLNSRSGGDDRTAPAGSARPAAATAEAVPVSSVRASASTTQHPDGAISYAAANTLDGRAATAWNSDGQGAGATLTYTFAAPVDLTSITVLNGYQKMRTGAHGKTVDLFALNQRVKALRVVTDAGSVAWTLRDDRAPQTLTRAFGPTRTVRLEVLSTYPSRRYTDLAVSEVRFTARG
jgi:hypothetical protein